MRKNGNHFILKLRYAGTGEMIVNVTVSDCMKLPTFREARVVAGSGGLNRVVASVSVMEYPDIPVLSSDLIVGNELMISALTQIMDDVDMQCRLVRHLHFMGTACIVIFYVGVYVRELDQRLLATADELDFPLIVMPFGRMNCRYSDMITDVMELVLYRQRQERHYASDMVNRLAQLQPEQRTIKTVLRLLSDRLRCTLLLVDRYMERRGFAPWPLSAQLDCSALLDSLKSSAEAVNDPREMLVDGKCCLVWCMPVNSDMHRGFQLIVIDEQRQLEYDMLQQAVEVIELFLNIWNKNTFFEGTDALVHAILTDRPDEMTRLASKMHIDIGSIHTMWVMLIDNFTGGALIDSQRRDCILKAKLFLQEYHKLTVVDSFGPYIIALSDANLFDGSESDLAENFRERLHGQELELTCSVFSDIDTTAQAREAFVLTSDNLVSARRVYPERHVFTNSTLRFVKDCRDALEVGEERARQKMAVLERLEQQSDASELIQTLCVYLLDAESNTQKTGAILYMHKNSVNYRLNKIRNILGSDLSQMPSVFEIYQAAALYRLLN